MLLSMTGFGESRREDENRTIRVEIKSLNGRHLKLSTRVPESHSRLEPSIERLIRDHLNRGTIQFSLKVDRIRQVGNYQLNQDALQGYLRQVKEVLVSDTTETVELTSILPGLLQLPGVVESTRSDDSSSEEDWPALKALVEEALGQLQERRAVEGRAMGEDLRTLIQEIERDLLIITERIPEVVHSYRDRLLDRIQILLGEQGSLVEPDHLAREVAIFADRSDIHEELTRLQAHLGQFRTVLHEEKTPGRKLEFIVQEIGREVNTIGSKASDMTVSKIVVEIKSRLEKIREMIQNIE